MKWTHHTRRRLTARRLPIVTVLTACAVWFPGPTVGAGRPFAHRKLANVTFVAFDTETTGVNPKRDRIVEIAAVKYRNGEVIGEKNWLVNPGRTVPRWAQRVHGISTEMVQDAPSFAKVYPEFLAFVEDAVLVAHNAPFDIAFINEELDRTQLKPPPNAVIDSLGLFRKWFPDLKSHSLQNVADHAEVRQDAFHRALADSMYVALIFSGHVDKLDASTRLGDIYATAGGRLGF
jgi:DNA polymerase III epsilon subunit family exonuclease